MSIADFIHLRVHTAYSLSEGAIPVSKLGPAAVELGMPAVAVTDSNNLFGALEASQDIMKAGVQPIIGLQLALSVGDAQGGLTKVGLRKPEPQSIVLLAQNEEGYRNLMALSSEAYLHTPPGETPHVAFETLERHAAGLLCLSGGPGGPLNALVLASQTNAAQELVQKFMRTFPGRFYIELQRHGLAAEEKAEPALLDIAYQFDIPFVATNDCYFLTEDMYEAHDVLLCIAEGAYVSMKDRRRVTPHHRFKSASEMRAIFADLPEACDNTIVIAQRCAFAVPKRDPILPNFTDGARQSEADLLRQMAGEGLDQRLAENAIPSDQAPDYRARLDYELGVIERMGFAGYFLIVSDFVKWAKNNGVPVGPGRGSGAGSLAAYALRITDLDPIRYKLLFERFLNPDRVSMPDFDIDFCQEHRDKVIAYVQHRYGADQVAQIATFGKLQARAALRDVGRVLQLPLGQVDRICKMVPNNPANPISLPQAIEIEPRLREERDRDPDVARMIKIALKLEGLYRNASTHAAGVVIGDRPLMELVPLYRDQKGGESAMPATQFSMKHVEQAGLVKFDFLGLKTLTVIERAADLIRQDAPDFRVETIPLDDAETYAMLSRGETMGVFQLEGAGVRDTLRGLKPERIEDIIAVVALYRPGPMANIPKYNAVKHGHEPASYPHPMLEPILEETYGIIVYQEQVMQIAQAMAGYSLAEADLLRRAMGKKIKSEMDAQQERFVSGAVQNGVDAKTAQSIFELLAKFAEYGFNKSHAAAYAVVAYQTAWLKAHYPEEFLAASMTLDAGNTDKLNAFRQEALRLGIAVLPPDVNRSQAAFAVEKNRDGKKAIRYALGAVRNVGEAAMEALVAERRKNGPYQSIFNFAERMDPQLINKRSYENLIKAGAFDSLDPNRPRLLASVDLLVRHTASSAQEKSSSQVSLFGGGAAASAPLPPLVDADPWTIMEKLAREFEAIGFYLSAHPLDAYKNSMRRLGIVPFTQLMDELGGTPVRKKLAGTIISKKERTSAKGNRFAFIQCSDTSGLFEVTVFSETLAQHRDGLVAGQSFVFTVDARMDEEKPRMTVQSIESLEKLAANLASGLALHIEEPSALERVKAILDATPKGKGVVALHLRLDARTLELELPNRFSVSPQMRETLAAVRGVAAVTDY